jgi:LuxR family transcriptional regulator, maltose regulon positive regulatory protein
MATHAAKQVMTGSRGSAAFVGNPILASKITAPDVPDWALQRPRLTKVIAQGMRRCPLTLITGPLGAGKTMTLTLWVAVEAGPVAWVSLDEYDNRPGVFWSYVVSALHRSGAPIPKALSATVRGQTAEHLFLSRLASVLAAQNPPVTLVLDDLHLLTEPRALNGLDFLLRNAGAGLRLLVSARTDPPLPLHRYRLAGGLTEIRGSDLAFSAAEAAELFSRHRCALSEDSVESLLRLTEGWAAGLRLAALSLAGHPDPDQLAGELVAGDLAAESALNGYLAQEVLGAQPPESKRAIGVAAALTMSRSLARDRTHHPTG